MDRLPFDAQEEVFALLSINDRANCRLVSSSFKQMAEADLRQITHLKMLPLNDKPLVGWRKKLVRRCKILQPLYIRENFMSKPFVRGLVKCNDGRNGKSVDGSFFAFLEKFCPNLKVLEMKRMQVTHENMLHVASSVQFFICDHFDMPLNFQQLGPQGLIGPFAQLQGLTEKRRIPALDWPEHLLRRKSAHFVTKQLLKMHRPICKINLRFFDETTSFDEDDPLKKSDPLDENNPLDLETIEYLAWGKVKCLDVRNGVTLSPDYFTPSLAQSLLCLTINLLPLNETSLPNLTYLRMKVDHFAREEQLQSYEQRMPIAPNLRSFSYYGSFMHFPRAAKLFKYVLSLEKLEELHLEMFIPGDEQMETFVPPPNLKRLTFQLKSRTDSPLQLGNESHSLRYLDVSPMDNLQFDLPNLRQLLCPNVLLHSGPAKLISSLSKCHKLQLLELAFEDPKIDFLQALIDQICKLTRLDHLSLTETYSTLIRVGTIRFDQTNLPLLRRLSFDSGHKIVFRPSDKFQSLGIASQLDIHSERGMSLVFKSNKWDRYYKMKGKSFQVIFTEPMNHLTHIICKDAPLPTLISQEGNYVTRLKKFEIYFDGQVSADKNFDPHSCEAFFSSLQVDTFIFNANLQIDSCREWFNLFNCFKFVKRAQLQLQINEEPKVLQVLLPSSFQQVKFSSTCIIDFCGSSSDSLLSLDALDAGNFHLPNLQELCMATHFGPPHEDLPSNLSKSPHLRCISLQFNYGNMPKASFIQALVDSASQLNQLHSFKMSYCSSLWMKAEDTRVIIKQKDISSVTNFYWNLPVLTTFTSENTFDELIIGKNSMKFQHEQNECTFHFENVTLQWPALKDELYKLTRVKVIRINLKESSTQESLLWPSKSSSEKLEQYLTEDNLTKALCDLHL